MPVITRTSRGNLQKIDLAQTLNKEAGLEMRGEETEIDRTMVELVSDPLVHLIRNALDHGLDSPDERERAGKARKGAICTRPKSRMLSLKSY